MQGKCSVCVCACVCLCVCVHLDSWGRSGTQICTVHIEVPETLLCTNSDQTHRSRQGESRPGCTHTLQGGGGGGGRERGRERGREGGREQGREGGREGGRERQNNIILLFLGCNLCFVKH